MIVFSDEQVWMMLRVARLVPDDRRDEFFAAVCDALRRLDPPIHNDDVRSAARDALKANGGQCSSLP
jgi:hypothetical protein